MRIKSRCFLFFFSVLAASQHTNTQAKSVAQFTTEFLSVSDIKESSNTQKGGKDSSCPWPEQHYEIGKFEVSNIEYAAFLNSVARVSDPYKLFSILQTEHFWGGIIKVMEHGEASYLVKPGYEMLPATFVSWHDAMRFANWLHFGRPNTGKSELGTTEGNSELGAYDTRTAAKNTAGQKRNQGAKYFIPTCGEWLAAGFTDPVSKKTSQYAGGDEVPQSAPPNTSTRTANFYHGHWALPYPHLAPVNAYSNNPSKAGTLNQAGNVMEWVESRHFENQMALGGSVFLPEDTLRIGYRDSELPSKKLSSFGFRMARAAGIDFGKKQTFSASVAANIPEHVHTVGGTTRAAAGAWTLIDRPGNASDIKTGYGCVARSFELSRTEITNTEYAAFLNAVAQEEDRHGLYLDDMSTGVAGGIVRTMNQGLTSFSVKPGFENRPAAYLSWFTLARLANWHHFGRPRGKQVLGVTEGDDKTGAYDTRNFEKFTQSGRRLVVSSSTFTRNAGAKYFIPNADEWYKAAYYDPNRTGIRKYWDYPNRSNTPPANDGNQDDSANYQIEGLGEGAPYYVSNAGQYRAQGYFDVVDMGGNLWEWLESWRGLGGEDCWRCDVPTKGLRGGSFNYISIGLWSGNTDPGFPSDHYFVYGGRLARVIEGSPSEEGWCAPANMRTEAAKIQDRVKRHGQKLVLLGAALLAMIVAYALLKRSQRAS